MDGYRAAAALLVDRDATRDELRRAFRARAKELHPDAGPGSSTADFIQLREAFDLLMETASDPVVSTAPPVPQHHRSPFDVTTVRPRYSALDIADAPQQRRHRSPGVRPVDADRQARGRKFSDHLAAARANGPRKAAAGF